nr:MAG TPA: hypothetical protein [Bacteriophage sp.]
MNQISMYAKCMVEYTESILKNYNIPVLISAKIL